MFRTARSGPPSALLILGALVVPAFLAPAAPSMTYTESLSEVDVEPGQLDAKLREKNVAGGTALAVLRAEAAGSPLAEGLPAAADGHVVPLRSADDRRTGSRR